MPYNVVCAEGFPLALEGNDEMGIECWAPGGRIGNRHNMGGGGVGSLTWVVWSHCAI